MTRREKTIKRYEEKLAQLRARLANEKEPGEQFIIRAAMQEINDILYDLSDAGGMA